MTSHKTLLLACSLFLGACGASESAFDKVPEDLNEVSSVQPSAMDTMEEASSVNSTIDDKSASPREILEVSSYQEALAAIDLGNWVIETEFSKPHTSFGTPEAMEKRKKEWGLPEETFLVMNSEKVTKCDGEMLRQTEEAKLLKGLLELSYNGEPVGFEYSGLTPTTKGEKIQYFFCVTHPDPKLTIGIVVGSEEYITTIDKVRSEFIPQWLALRLR